MNTELFIAKRIYGGKGEGKISKPMTNIAIIGIVLGLSVMILTIAIVTGYKKEIKAKITGFGSHIIITNYDSNNSLQTIPISKEQDFYPSITEIDGIEHIQIFATKVGIIKTEDNFEGVMLKGIGKDFDWSFIDKNIVEGEKFALIDTVKSNFTLISKKIALSLSLKVGDKITCYFIQQPPRMRRFTISGIFEIEIEEFSKLILVDIGHIQKLNDWEENQISGFEIFIDNYDKLDYLSEKVEELTEFNFDKKSSLLKTSTVKQLYPQSLYWIELFDTNTIVILILMVIVAGFNMISGLFIIILERINMIGILKALGTENWSIRKLFLYHASFLIGKGLFWGNFAGISLCLLQKYFGLVTLDPSTYYISVVPINFSIIHILLINLGTLIITVSMLILPTIIITKISPAKAIRFE
ncbi:MAG: ABC transporter permease [Bacteroidetes bacterium]|nr:ABC transporter permease [Bacteroidota bacterium]MBT6685746.1 ABC transporter permease [Bacteroidota bacterium]MBT7142949.1 ABC transporter permease [Bacteroidota bacterium]